MSREEYLALVEGDTTKFFNHLDKLNEIGADDAVTDTEYNEVLSDYLTIYGIKKEDLDSAYSYQTLARMPELKGGVDPIEYHEKEIGIASLEEELESFKESPLADKGEFIKQFEADAKANIPAPYHWQTTDEELTNALLMNDNVYEFWTTKYIQNQKEYEDALEDYHDVVWEEESGDDLLGFVDALSNRFHSSKNIGNYPGVTTIEDEKGMPLIDLKSQASWGAFQHVKEVEKELRNALDKRTTLYSEYKSSGITGDEIKEKELKLEEEIRNLKKLVAER